MSERPSRQTMIAASLGAAILIGGAWWVGRNSRPAPAATRAGPTASDSPSRTPASTPTRSATSPEPTTTLPETQLSESELSRRLADLPTVEVTPATSVVLPPYLAGREFRLADGGFLSLWYSQQAVSAEEQCWRVLDEEHPALPRSIAYRITVDDAGAIDDVTVSIRQSLGVDVTGSRASAIAATKLARCLIPFVKAVRLPSGAPQRGEVRVVRPKAPAPKP